MCISELGAWLGEEGARGPGEGGSRGPGEGGARGPGAAPERLPAHAKRLLADAYMCFYRSPDVAMYR